MSREVAQESGERRCGGDGLLPHPFPFNAPCPPCPGCPDCKPDPQPDRGERRDDLLEMLEVWAKWIGDDCAVGMEDTNRQLCAIDIRRAATQIEHLQARVEEEKKRREHCEQWYAERIRRITDTARREGIWDEIACILANGTAGAEKDPYEYEPPTYAQQLNWAKHRAEKAERQRDAACEERDESEGRERKAEQTIAAVREELRGRAEKERSGDPIDDIAAHLMAGAAQAFDEAADLLHSGEGETDDG